MTRRSGEPSGRAAGIGALARVTFAAAALLGCQSVLELDEGQSVECGGGACCPTAVETCEGACGTMTDRCGSSVECGGCPRWAKSFGDASDQAAERIASFSVPGASGVLISGTFLGSIDFGASQGGPHSAQSEPGVFFASFGGFGDPSWSRAISSGGLHHGFIGDGVFGGKVEPGKPPEPDITFAAGDFSGDLELDGAPSKLTAGASTDIFLARLDLATGKTIGANHYGDSPASKEGHQGATAVAANNGRIFLAGAFENSLVIGPTTLTAETSHGSFVAAFNADNQPAWARRLGGDGGDLWADAIVGDSFGNAVVAGRFRSSLDIDMAGAASGSPCVPLSSAGGDDLFVVKLNDTGTEGLCAWALRIGGAGRESEPKITVDLGGNMIMAGQFEGEVSVGDATYESEGLSDALLVKIDPGGRILWSKRIGGVAGERVADVAVDSLHNVLVLGHFAGAIDLGGGPLMSAGQRDLFLVKLDVDGRYLWSRRLGGSGDDVGAGIRADFDGNIYLAGGFEGVWHTPLLSSPLESAGGRDVFLAKVSP